MAKQWAHDRRLGYTGDKDGKNAFAPSLSATRQRPLTNARIKYSLGNGYYYALNPREPEPSAEVLKELKALTVKDLSPAKEAK